MTAVVVRGDLVQGVLAACALASVSPPMGSVLASGSAVQATATLTWTPDLSPADLATVQSIVKLAVGSTLLTKAERDNLEPDFTTLRAYANAASPTNAQTIAAVKSVIDVLRAFVRD